MKIKTVIGLTKRVALLGLVLGVSMTSCGKKDQQGQQHAGVIGCTASPAIGFFQRAYIQAVDHFDDESGQVVLREPFVQRGWQQVPSLAVNTLKAAHLSAGLGGNAQIIPAGLLKSDRLLDQSFPGCMASICSTCASSERCAMGQSCSGTSS